jgi:hypothetical protein
MTHFALLALGIVLAMGVLTWLCLPGASRRVIATSAFAILTVCAFAANVESTGQPKPISLEWREVLDSPIVGLAWNEDEGVVWAWIMRDGAPVAYAFPWPEDKKQMGELQNRWRRKGSTGDEFQLSMEGDVAKVVPPKPMPEKTQ